MEIAQNTLFIPTSAKFDNKNPPLVQVISMKWYRLLIMNGKNTCPQNSSNF